MTSTVSPSVVPRKAVRSDGGTLLEVQALRAVAVLLVVVYHVWPHRIASGFVGVDVFFVISGFLITSHLLREIHRTGRIAVTHFWARRIRRLLPASFVVLAACAVLLWTVYPVVFRAPGMQQISFASFYGLNWLLGANAVDYLHAGDTATLVQHFWSLSVEEQFYIAWPLLLLATVLGATRFFRDRGGFDVGTLAVVLTSAVVIVSLVYSVVTSHYKPAFAYFDTGTRAWELGLGALFAAVLARWPQQVERVRASPFLARSGFGLIVGVVLIAGSALFIGPDREFPGWVALFPTMGALVIIAVGMPRVSLLRPLVGWRPVQYIGDISYELYLVHWPLLVTFGVLAGTRPGAVSGMMLIVVAVVLAAVLHHGVKVLPRMWSALWQQRRVAFAFAAVGAIVFTLGAAGTAAWQQARIDAAMGDRDRLIQADGRAPSAGDPLACVGAAAMLSGADCDNRFVLGDNVDLAAAAVDLDRQNWCLTWYDQDWLQCEGGDLTAPNGTIALLGDSHAGAWYGAMSSYFASRGWKVISYTRFGCTGLEQPNPALSGETDAGKMWDACVSWGDRARAEIASRTDIDAVVMANWQLSDATPPAPGLPPHLDANTIATSLRELGSGGKPLVYVEDAPNTTGTPVPECLAAAQDPSAPCATLRSERYIPDLMQDGIAASGLDVAYVPTVDAYCDSVTCYSVVGGVVVYTDDNHISDTWARSLVPYVGKQVLDGIAARPSGGEQ